VLDIALAQGDNWFPVRLTSVSEPMYVPINFGVDARWPGPCDAMAP
jgi:hypothetical protein